MKTKLLSGERRNMVPLLTPAMGSSGGAGGVMTTTGAVVTMTGAGAGVGIAGGGTSPTGGVAGGTAVPGSAGTVGTAAGSCAWAALAPARRPARASAVSGGVILIGIG